MLTSEWQAPCAADSPQCVEVRLSRGVVQVRNNQVPCAAPTEATRQEWAAFVDAVKAGAYDLP